MKKLLEAINRGILRGLNELTMELLSDLDDSELDLADSLLAKSVNSKIHVVYKYFPTTKEELVEIIKDEVEEKGWKCSLNHIDTSKITDMSNLFSGNRFNGYKLGEFNGDISKWDVSNVTTMANMFYENSSFNRPIGNWEVSNVTNMHAMFLDATTFNQPIGDWDVSNVTDMSHMFLNATSFNQPIGDWDMTAVMNICRMFWCATSFNQPIGNWDVSSVTDMYCMFYGAESFNLPIGDWTVSNVEDMEAMFYNATSFNQDISKWKRKTNCNTYEMFTECPIKEEYKPIGIK